MLFLSSRGSGIQEWFKLHNSVSRSLKKLYLGCCPELLLLKGFTEAETSATKVASSCCYWNSLSSSLAVGRSTQIQEGKMKIILSFMT